MNDENITKIFHYGRADLAHIKHYLNVKTNNIRDTKIASKLARSYSDNHSLKTLKKNLKIWILANNFKVQTLVGS